MSAGTSGGVAWGIVSCVEAEDMQRSEWFPPEQDPWEDGVYEVEFLRHFGEPIATGFARFWKKPPNGFSNHWSSLQPTVKEAAGRAAPSGPLRPHWRGISEKQAQALGEVRASTKGAA